MTGFSLFILLLFFAPLFYGGNRPIPLLILELWSLLLVYLLLKNHAAWQKIPKSYLGFVGLLFLFPLIQLLPLPMDFWSMFSGRAAYSQALSGLGISIAHDSRPLSLVPAATEYAWLALLPPLTVFLFILTLAKDQIKALVLFLIGFAFFQSVLGLMQYGMGAEGIFRFVPESGKVAVGTYVNRDHFAGFLEMLLPICLAMLTAHLGRNHVSRRHARTLRQRIAVLADTHISKGVVYGFAAVIMFLALVFTQSRTGVFLGMLLVFLSALAFSTRLGGRNVYGLLGTFAALSIVLAFEVGMVPVINRFIEQDPLQDARWQIYADVMNAIGEFFPLGSGFGTFIEVYPRFQSDGFAGRIVNNAHNDYLQWLMEGGIIAALFIVVFMVFYIKHWPQIWKRGEWRYFNFVQVGAGIGIFCIVLHSLVDFNLHIPANQIYFAVLAGLFFYPQEENVLQIAAEPEKDSVVKESFADVIPEKKSYVVKSDNPFSL